VCCSVLQCIAVCMSVLQRVILLQAQETYKQGNYWHVAVCCSVLQCVAVCCSVLRHVALCCNALQCVAVCYLSCGRRGVNTSKPFATPNIFARSLCCSVLQCVAVCCSVLQCVAV